jgi:hypothetical protein
MNARRLAAILALVIVPAARSAPAPKSSGGDDAPYKSVKVGDFATYKMTTKVAGISVDGVMTQTVTAKSDKEVTIKTAAKVAANGMDVPTPEQESTIDLTKPFDPLKSGVLGPGAAPGGAAPTYEKLKDGKEKLTVAGKEYEATWTTYKFNMNAGGQQLEAEMKVWSSTRFSFYMLKTEVTMDLGGMKMDMTMELTEVGAKGK